MSAATALLRGILGVAGSLHGAGAAVHVRRRHGSGLLRITTVLLLRLATTRITQRLDETNYDSAHFTEQEVNCGGHINFLVVNCPGEGLFLKGRVLIDCSAALLKSFSGHTVNKKRGS